jgi:outer membrane protein
MVISRRSSQRLSGNLIGIGLCFVLIMGCGGKGRYAYEKILVDHGTRGGDVQAPGRASSPIPKAVTDPLPLDQAVRIALEGSPEIEMALARIRQAEAMVEEAHAAFWPVISIFGEYLQGDAPSSYLFKTIDQRRLSPGVDFNEPGWFETYEWGVHARLNLFSGGRDLLRKRMAETGRRIQDLDRQSIENALVESVIHAYFQVLAAQDYREIAEESVRTVEEQKRVAEVRHRAGGALRSDLLFVEVRLAQAKEERIRAGNHHELSLSALAVLLSIDPDEPLRLQEERAGRPFPRDYPSGLLQALAHRPELKKVREQVVQSAVALDVARSEYLPRLDAHAKYYMADPDADFSATRDNWVAGILLNWDLFTGFSTRAKVEQAGSLLEEMIALDRKTAQMIQLELKSAYLKLAEAEARLQVARASEAQAEETLLLVKREYEGGSAMITRYLDAELALRRARILAKGAYYDQEKAKASVARGIGFWSIYAEEVRKEDGK